MEDEIKIALEKDLGRDVFLSWLIEVSGTIMDIKHAYDNTKRWALDEVVDTPLTIGPGSSKIIWEPLGVALILSAWNYPIVTSI